MEAEESVRVERCGHTLLLTINRPAVRNAVDESVTVGLADALVKAEEDSRIRVVVLTGAGDRSFCAGADLRVLAAGGQIAPHSYLHWGFAGYVRHPISKPTIAAVNGTALGGGMELVLASDLAIAAENATFSLPEVKRGVVAAGGGAVRLPIATVPKLAMEILLTGESIDAATAYDLGLINRVVPVGGALDAALDLADRISANAPLAVQATKRVAAGVIDGFLADETKRWAASEEESCSIRRSEDAREGAIAFVQKRPPVWRSR